MEAYTCGSPTAQILGEWSSSRSSLQPIRRPRISESLRRPQRAPTESSDFSIPETYSSSDDDLQHAGRSSPPPPHDGVRHNNNNDVQRSSAMAASPPPPPDHDGNSRRSTGKFLSPPPQQTHAEMHPNSNAHPPPVVAASSPPPHAEMYHPKNSRSSTALFSSPPPEQHNADYSTNTSQPAPALIPPTDQRHVPPSRSAPPPTWWLNHPTPEEAAATSSRGAPRRRRGKHPHPVRMMKEPQLIPYEVAWPRTTRDLTKAPQQHQHAPAAPSRPTAAATARDSSSQRPLPTSVAPTTTTNNLAQNDVSERSITPPSGHHRKPVDEYAPPTQHVPPTHGVPPHATSSRRPTDAQDDVSERSITPPSGYRRERLPSHYLQGDASSTVVQDAPHAVHRLEPLTPQRPAATTLEVMMQDEGHVAAPHHTSPLPPITPRTLSPAPPITTPLLMDDRPPTAPSRRPQHTTPLLSASNSSAALAPSRTVAAPVDGVESAHANPNTNEWADVAKEGGGAHGSQPRLMRNNDEIEPRTEVEEVLLGTMTGSTPLRRRFSSETPRFIRRAPTSSVSAPFDDSIDDGDDSDIPSSVRSPRRSAPHPATQRAMNAAPEEEAVPQAPQQPADASHHSAEEAGTKLVPSTRRRSEGAKYDGDADAARNANDDSSEVRVKDEIVPRTEVGDVLLGTMTGSTPLRLRFSSETSQKWAPLHHSRSSPVDYSINSGLPAEAVHASAQPAPHPATQRAMDAAPEEEDVPLSVHHPEDAPQQSGEEAQSTPVPSTHRESEEAKDGDAHVARNTHDDPSGRRAQDEIEPRTEVEDVLLGTTTGSTPLRRRFSSETPRFIRRAPTSSVSAPFDDSIDEGDDVPSSVRSPSRSALHPATQRAMNSAPEEEAKQDVPRAPQQPADASLLAHPEDAPQQSGEEAQSTPVPSTYRESEEAKDVDAHVERNTNDDPSGGSAQDEIEPRTEVEDVLLGTMTGSTPLQRRFSSETPRFIRRAPTSSIDDSDVPSSVRSMPRSAPHPATQRAMNAAPEEEEEEAAPQAPQQPEDASHHSAEEAGTPSAANRTLHNSPSPTSHPNAQVSSNAEVENLRRSPPLQTLGSYSESAIAPRTVPLSPDNRGAVMSEGESVPSASHSHVVQTRRPRKAPAPSSSSVVSGDGAETTEEAAPQGAGDAAPHQHVDHPPSPTADRHSIRPADDEETPPLPQQHTSANMLGVEDESFIPSPIHQLSEIDVDR